MAIDDNNDDDDDDDASVVCRTFQLELEKCAQEPERVASIFLRYVSQSLSDSVLI